MHGLDTCHSFCTLLVFFLLYTRLYFYSSIQAYPLNLFLFFSSTSNLTYPFPPCSANPLCISLYDFLYVLISVVCARAYLNPHHSLLYIHTLPFLSCCILSFHSFVLIYLFFLKMTIIIKVHLPFTPSSCIRTIWNS